MEAALISQSIADLALILVQLGFAALLGFSARYTNTWLQKIAFALAVLAYIASSLAVPLDWPINAISGVASVLVFLLAAWQASLSASRPRATWWYAAFAMLVIVSWSATQGWFLPVVLLGVAAACAAVLSWRRGFSAAG